MCGGTPARGRVKLASRATSATRRHASALQGSGEASESHGAIDYGSVIVMVNTSEVKVP